MGADECRVCYGYSNAGFDICEECAKKEERDLILERVANKLKKTFNMKDKYIVQVIDFAKTGKGVKE